VRALVLVVALALLDALVMVIVGPVAALVDSLNAWLQMGLSLAGVLAAAGAAWRWLIGPGFRRARATVTWVREMLELQVKLDRKLEDVDRQLARGEEHFQRIDAMLEILSSEEAREVRRAIREDRPVRVLEDGKVDRRVET
jgi:NAD(P)-dependent dehydrogenase (short-subunit alcohol dehydrogenase family)